MFDLFVFLCLIKLFMPVYWDRTFGRHSVRPYTPNLKSLLFINKTNAIIQKAYTPNIDDGVLINAAPFWGILPSWADTKKAWQELEAEKYDWAHQAMDHWPDRVRGKCKTNKFFTIAHGLA